MGNSDSRDREYSRSIAGRTLMKLISRIAGGLRALLRRNQVEAELDDELREFLERTIERNISRGMGIKEATRAARIEIGSLDVVKEQVRDVGWESRVVAF